jgi:hypothetical protein
MNLELVKEQIKSEIKVDETGKGTASIRATARLCDVSHTTLNKAFDGGNLNPGKLAGMLIQQGFNPETFLESGVPDLAVAVVVKYYAYSEYSGARCTEQARLVDLAFSGVGARSWMREIAGWQPPSISIPQSSTNPILLASLEARQAYDALAAIDKGLAHMATLAIMQPVVGTLPLPQQEQAPPATKTKNGKKKPEPEPKPDYFLPTGNYQPLENFFINQRVPSEVQSTFDVQSQRSEHVKLMSVIGSNVLIPWYKDCSKMRESLALFLLERGFDPDELLIKPW